ncbi:unnamed protein product [Amoebophrya sp. A25]|nr:unnamed protein product [Amoebophrya sp. A25]|eukprot:GSA25T00007772001.1
MTDMNGQTVHNDRNRISCWTATVAASERQTILTSNKVEVNFSIL